MILYSVNVFAASVSVLHLFLRPSTSSFPNLSRHEAKRSVMLYFKDFFGALEFKRKFNSSKLPVRDFLL